MRKLLLTAALVASTSAAHAQLFTPGASFTMSLGNSPTTENDIVTFSPGVTQTIAGGLLNVTVTVVNAANYATTGAQWVVLDYQTTSADQPLSLGGENWSLAPVGLPAAKALNIVGDYTQWQGPDGANIAQTGRIFGQTLMASPIPGLVGSGEGTLGYSGAIGGPGPLPSLGGFADPFQIVLNGLPAKQVNGEIAGLEFAPQTFTPGAPEASTWAMMLLGFAGLGAFGYRQSLKTGAAEA